MEGQITGVNKEELTKQLREHREKEQYKAIENVSEVMYNRNSDGYTLLLHIMDERKGEESAANMEVYNMNGDDILKTYIENVDKDRRESEQRMTSGIEAMETRIDKHIETMQQHSNKVEDRMDHRLDRIEDFIKDQNKTLGDKIDGNNKFILGISITTILGIAAMVIAVLTK